MFKVWEGLPESEDADKGESVCIEYNCTVCGWIELGRVRRNFVRYSSIYAPVRQCLGGEENKDCGWERESVYRGHRAW